MPRMSYQLGIGKPPLHGHPGRVGAWGNINSGCVIPGLKTGALDYRDEVKTVRTQARC